jgi:hypothetical protein
MLALISDCFIVEQHASIWFLLLEGAKPSKIHKRMLAQYKENFIVQRKVYQWVQRFQSGRTSNVGEDHFGHPTTSWTVGDVEWVNVLVQDDRWITVTYIANKLHISCVYAHFIIHKDDITKFVQGGCQSSKGMCGNVHTILAVERLSCNVSASL